MTAIAPIAPAPTADPHGAGHTIFTQGKQADFLAHLATFGNVRLACRAARVSAQTVYRARRRSLGLARAWDAALLAARQQAEQVLADRALNGWEEPVYYHGEEVARRRRFSDRLLLAHLARLDKLETREEVAAAIPQLDDAIEALRDGQEPDLAQLGKYMWDVDLLDENGFYTQDRVPCVPSCREEPCGESDMPSSSGCEAQPEAEPIGQTKNWEESDEDEELDEVCGDEREGEDVSPSSSGAAGQTDAPSRSGAVGQQTTFPPCEECGGRCNDPDAELTDDDCDYIGQRLERMDRARPRDADKPCDIAGSDLAATERIETLQLEAFEAGVDEWWLVGRDAL